MPLINVKLIEGVFSENQKRTIAGSGIRLSDRGLHQLKGVPGKQPLVAVDAMAESKRLRAASGMTAHPRQARTDKRRTQRRTEKWLRRKTF